MGFWDPLSSHFPYNKELPPAGISSWTRLRLNWIDPEKIALVKLGQTATIKLDPLTSQNASTYVIKIPLLIRPIIWWKTARRSTRTLTAHHGHIDHVCR